MRFITWYFYQSYSNPLSVISLVWLATHPSVLSFSTVLVAWAFQIVALTWADAQCSLKHLKEAYNDVIAEGSYRVYPLDDATSKDVEDFSSIGIYRKLPTFTKDILGKNPWYAGIFAEPLKIFVAEEKDGKVFAEPKAYTNFRGSSLIFLPRPFDQLDALDRFLLLHELEHVNLDGARQLSRFYSRPLLLLLNSIILFSLSTVYWQHLVILAYIAINLIAHFQVIIKREVIADNGALLKLSTAEEQTEVIELLIELSSSYLLNSNLSSSWLQQPFHFRQDEKKALLKESLKLLKTKHRTLDDNQLKLLKSGWMDRLLHFRWYENCLKENRKIPYLGWSSFYDTISMVPMGIFFLYLGSLTSSVPVFPFVLIGSFIAVETLLLQSVYMNELAKVSNDIETEVRNYLNSCLTIHDKKVRDGSFK